MVAARLRRVADDIAHAPDGIERARRLRVTQHGAQPGKVAMYVREDGDAHAPCYPPTDTLSCMDVGDLGEFGLIERLRAALPAAAPGRLVVGIGDDAAVWRTGSGYTVATTDTMVAGVHFLPGAVAWHDVGWKALATNVSDIAAMGGTPTFALVTLCLPSDTAVDDIDALYAGLRECAEAYGVTIAGGDIVVGARVRDHHRADGRRAPAMRTASRCCCAAMRRAQAMLSRSQARSADRRADCAR